MPSHKHYDGVFHTVPHIYDIVTALGLAFTHRRRLAVTAACIFTNSKISLLVNCC